MSQLGIEVIAKELNERSPDFAIGSLQELRVQLKGLKHAQCHTIFSFRKNTTPRRWAFHSGGRTELQFNIGFETIENVDNLRHGVAFSLESSRSHSFNALISRLRDKIMRFNDFIRQNEEAFSGFQMWHWQVKGKNERRFPDHQPNAITADLIKKGFFIFLGSRQPLAKFDYVKILSDFDRLLPLYTFVESGGKSTA